MPNKCTVCGKIHPDNAPYLVNGCDRCGSKFFFFVKESDIKKAEEDLSKLSRREIEEIERDIREILPECGEETVILDIEAIRVIKPGKYKIDVTTLFSQKPIVIRIGPGKYELDLSVLLPKKL